jgi:hypothetical protein
MPVDLKIFKKVYNYKLEFTDSSGATIKQPTSPEFTITV